MANSLQRLLAQFPDKPWDFDSLCGNPNIGFHQVLARQDDYWNMSRLSGNPAVSEQNIRNHPELCWNSDFFVFNDSLSFEFVKQQHAEQNLWHPLARRKDITLEFVLSNIRNFDHAWHLLSENPKVVHQAGVVIEKSHLPWNKFHLCKNPALNIAQLQKCPKMELIFFELSSNPNVRMQDVLAHPKANWSWSALPYCTAITVEDILSQACLPWHWDVVSMNVTITLRIVTDNLNHPHCEWNWYWLSRNPGLSVDEILNSPDLPWDWDGVSRNPNLRYEHVAEHPDKAWNWREISANHLHFNWMFEKLQRLRQLERVRRIRRIRLQLPGMRNWYSMYRLTLTRAFNEWWYSPDMPGGVVAKRRLLQLVT